MPNSQPWFLVYMNEGLSRIKALLEFGELQRGAYIGLAQAKTPFYFKPLGAARFLDDGSFLIWMANVRMLGIKLPPELADMHWFMVLLRPKIPFEPDIRAVIYYPDANYRSPETMVGVLPRGPTQVEQVEAPIRPPKD